MTLATAIAETACGLGDSDIPPGAIDQVSLAILDVIGVMVAGLDAEPAAGYLAYLDRWGGPGPCTVVGVKRQHAPADAARTNGALAHVLDFDDRGHASTHLFAAALAAAEVEPVDGRTFLRAIIVARETRAALDLVVDDGRMEGRGAGSRGWHSTGVNGPIASALAGGMILGLDASRLAMAMAMAASASSGLIGNFGTATKPLHAGRAAAEGVTAALLVRDGLNADPAAIDGPSGLFEALGVDRVAAAESVLARFGRTWDLVERGVRIKPYPSCTTAHVGIETARRIHDRVGPIPAERIRTIRMDLRPFMLRRLVPTTATEARFNMLHGVLAALETGEVAADDYMSDRVLVRAEARHYDLAEHVEGSRTIEIDLDDGTTIREELAPLRNLTSTAQIEDKFRASTRRWPTSRQDDVVACLADLRSVADVRVLSELLQG